MNDELLAEIRAAVDDQRCGGLWWDKGEPVCGTHGCLWPQDNEFCNSVEDVERAAHLLLAEVDVLRERVRLTSRLSQTLIDLAQGDFALSHRSTLLAVSRQIDAGLSYGTDMEGKLL